MKKGLEQAEGVGSAYDITSACRMAEDHFYFHAGRLPDDGEAAKIRRVQTRLMKSFSGMYSIQTTKPL